MNHALGPLLTVVALSVLQGTVRIYYYCARDWCGIRLLPHVIAQSAVPSMFVIILYVKFYELIEWAGLSGYQVPLYLAAAVVADLLVGRYFVRRPELLQSSSQPLPILPVQRRIAKKKIKVSRQLQELPNCRRVLFEAIDTSDLSRLERNQLKKSLSKPPTSSQILDVMRAVGLAHLKVLV